MIGVMGRSLPGCVSNQMERLEAEHAWVASAGPNFAPEITPIVTLYDLIEGLNRSRVGPKAQHRLVPSPHLPDPAATRHDALGV